MKNKQRVLKLNGIVKLARNAYMSTRVEESNKILEVSV